MRVLVVAVLVGAFLRLIWLGTLPPGFTPDEAAFGYNAYSLFHTGSDEWGTPFYKLPLTNLRSFGDDKLPLYAFFTAPSVAFLGMNEFATRLPSALFGVVAIPALYVATAKLFKSTRLANWSALLFALSPWSVQLSRGAFEANLVVTLLLITSALALQAQPYSAAIFSGLTMYAYHSGRLIAVPFLAIAYISFRLPHFRRFLLAAAVVLVPIILSVLLFGNARAKDVTILTPTDKWLSVADRRFSATIDGFPDVLSRAFVNKPTALFRVFTTNLLSYFSPQFLFTNGPLESTYGMLQGQGVLYASELASLAIGGIWLIRRSPRFGLAIAILSFCTLIPAALSKGPGLAANRAAPFMIPLILVSSLGAFIMQTRFPRLVVVVWGAFLGLSCVFFVQTYVVYGHRDLSHAMLYGYREAFTRALPLTVEYSEVRVSRSLSEPHIYTAFFAQVNPREYQRATEDWKSFSEQGFSFLDQMDGYRVGKYRFGSLFNTPITTSTLLIGKPEDFPANYPPHFVINNPDGTPAVIVAAAQP